MSSRNSPSVTTWNAGPATTQRRNLMPSPDGRWLAYGSKRGGVRQLFIRNLKTGDETQVTRLQSGHAAMWPHWRPEATK